MGLRTLNIPANAQPKDIGNPIPGQEDTLASILSGFRAPQMATPASQPQASPEPSLSQMLSMPQPSRNPAMAARAPAPAPASKADEAADDIFAELQSQEQDSKHMKAAKGKVEEDVAADIFGDLSEIKDEPEQVPEQIDFQAKVAAGLPRTRQGAFQALQKLYPDSKVTYELGAFTIERPNGKKFMYEPGAITSGDILEAGLGGAAELGVGALATPLTPAGQAGAMIAAAGPISAAASGVRTGLNQAMGIEEGPEFNAKNDALWAAGIGTLGAGAGQAVGGGFKAIRNALRNSQASRIEQAYAINRAVDMVHDDLVKSVGMAPGELTDRRVGESAKGAIESLQEKMQTRVGLVKDQALKDAVEKGMDFVPAEKGLQKLREIIGDRAVLNPKTGRLELTIKPQSVGEFAPPNIVDSSGRSLTRTPERLAEYEAGVQGIRRGERAAQTQLDVRQLAPAGDPSGTRELERMVDIWNTLNASKQLNGGVGLGDLYEQVTYFGNKSAFDESTRLTPKTLENYRAIRNAFATDQYNALDKVLEGSPMHGSYRKDFKDFSDKIDDVAEFMTTFDRKASAEKMADALLVPRNSQQLEKFARIVGNDSKQMKELRALWLSRAISDSIDPARPVFDGDAFLNAISKEKWGPESLKILAPDPKALNQLKAVARQAQRINTSDFWKQNPAAVGQVVNSVAGGWQNPVQAATNLFKVFRSNPEFSQYLAKKGIADIASDPKLDQAAKKMIMEGMDIYESLVDNSRVAKLARKGGKAVSILVPISRKAYETVLRPQEDAAQVLAEEQAAAEPSIPEPVDAAEMGALEE